MAKKKTSRRRVAATPVDNGSNLASMSTAELQAELRRRQGDVTRLQNRRERLVAQIAELDEQISSMGGVMSAGGGRRPRNDRPLGDVLAEVLSGQQLSVTEAAEAAIRSGYATTAENFRTIVNQRLVSDDRFKNVERGVYTLA
tara:strand:+ start:121 stop:549 length:429 start_codon:yes stop_codon:yes gene_type:complete